MAHSKGLWRRRARGLRGSLVKRCSPYGPLAGHLVATGTPGALVFAKCRVDQGEAHGHGAVLEQLKFSEGPEEGVLVVGTAVSLEDNR